MAHEQLFLALALVVFPEVPIFVFEPAMGFLAAV